MGLGSCHARIERRRKQRFYDQSDVFGRNSHGNGWGIPPNASVTRGEDGVYSPGWFPSEGSEVEGVLGLARR